MSYQMFLNLQPKQTPSLKQTQKLIMLPQMQQAINLLQLPVQELSVAVEAEMQRNPVLEYSEEPENPEKDETLESEPSAEKEMNFDERDFEILRQLDEDFRDHFSLTNNYYMKKTSEEEKQKTYQESLIRSECTLFEFLMKQAQETFQDQHNLQLAEQIIGNLDESGFLETPLEELAVLTNSKIADINDVLLEIQTFEPYGIGARNLQESLLIQMNCLGKKETLAYAILDEHYQNLLHNKIPVIHKKLKCTPKEVEEAIKQIAKLDLHPGIWYSRAVVQHIIPDVTLRQEEDKLIAEINDDSLPSLRLNSRYMRMLNDENVPKETKEFIKNKIMSAKWLFKNIHQRNDTLLRITESLAKIQKNFFLSPDGKLVPINMKTIAEELEVHESTVARAVANKYVNCPRGLLPLRSFFTTGYKTESGNDISAKTVRDVLLEIIQNEDKRKPYSDEILSALLKEKGINCARRTIAKYRRELNLGNAQQRKKY